MTLYRINAGIDMIANTKEEAEDCLCKILDAAFVYGLGLAECTAQDRKPGDEVARVFDYDWDEDEGGMMGELKPCPFCASDARVLKIGTLVGDYTEIRCINPFCNAAIVDEEERDAIRAWNTRVNE